MVTTYAELRPGVQFNIEVKSVKTQTVECKGTTVTRLRLTDLAGEQFSVFVVSDRNDLPEFEQGKTYHMSRLLCSQPVTPVEERSEECPDCGEQLRIGRVVDTTDSAVVMAAVEVGVDKPFGIMSATSTVEATPGEEDVVDDWVPMHDEQSIESPDFVCTACGRHVDDFELRGHEEMVMNESAPAPTADMLNSETLGLAAGGAKDVTNFRENVKQGFTPQPEAISDEGLFYDYYFDTGEQAATDALFAPQYAPAVTEHPLTWETERYLSVGLDSTLSVDEFERPRLDLVAVLDVSSSMESTFDEYYYDKQGQRREAGGSEKTKLSAATESLCALTEQLRPEDRLGVVLYNHRAHVAKPLRDVGATDMSAIRRHIREVIAGGGTNLEDGFEAAIDMLVEGTSGPQVERRVAFMTDMMPNTGATDERTLTELFSDAAAEGIHTTFIGMGLDANAELADALSGIRGANHYFIHSAEEFERRLGEEFDYMVTPLVYNLTLELEADGFEVEAVHGSPSADGDSTQLMQVGTLFPSAKDDGDARGGVILVRLKQQYPDSDLELVASWTERDGGKQQERVTISMPDSPEMFAHSGVRKAVGLARYARELRNWAQDIHKRKDTATGVDDWLLSDEQGQHERESVPLVVPDEYADRFVRLREYLKVEMEAVADDSLEQELELLELLCHGVETSPEVTE